MNLTGDLNGPDINPPKVLIIVGPTAVGKSAAAIAVANQLKGEIIALDSRQIYQHMPIGTDQPDDRLKAEIPHHLYGFKDPSFTISAGEYARLAEEIIEDIFKRNNQPIVCGGSGLYFRALTRGLFEGSATDLSIRLKLQKELKEKGVNELLRRLREIDPEYAKIVHPNNSKRLIRALEIYCITGVAPSEHFKQQKEKISPFQFVLAYLRAPIELLEMWIKERTRKMLESGWINEVQSLAKLGYSGKTFSMDSLGYKQIVDYLDGKISYQEMEKLINTSTRQYARKQLKWFNRERVDICIDIVEKKGTKYVANTIIEELK